ncbi:hypothetical protein C4D60_Mb00t07530 [Musa balbisiana]|uniref:Uncharacterized protein n=1 Tax=Musa balbisiana TaxID=52838 RepID=A0A4S8I5G6_MUSBA|nr:hypothetical protein C4D60_Mb00t07530 [Musa balbisiana]
MNGTPIFPMKLEVSHDSDHLQEASEEARRHSKRRCPRPLDSLHCKLQKPISKDDAKSKKRRCGWWKSALLFWRRPEDCTSDEHHVHRRSHAHSAAVLGPIYATESGVVVWRSTRRPSSGLLTAAEVGSEASRLAYLSLTDISANDGRRVAPYAAVRPAVPVYLVT